MADPVADPVKPSPLPFKHDKSPRPRRENDQGFYNTIESDGNLIAECYGNDDETNEANAAYLTKAGNAYPKLVQALKSALKVADEAAEEWDKAPSGMKPGKLLLALCGHVKGYRADITAIHDTLRDLGELP